MRQIVNHRSADPIRKLNHIKVWTGFSVRCRMKLKAQNIWFPLTVFVFSIPTAFLTNLGLVSGALVLLPVLAAFSMTLQHGMKYDTSLISRIMSLIPLPLLAISLYFPDPLIRSLTSIIFLMLMPYGFVSMLNEPLSARVALTFVIGIFLSILIILVGILTTTDLILPALALLASLSAITGVLAGGKKNSVEVPLNYLLEVLFLSIFFLVELSVAYPGILRMISNDLLYHQSYARKLILSPSKYNMWSYLGYHSILASTFKISSPDVLSLMISASILNFFAFLMVAASFTKLSYKEEALFLWSLLTGFGWLAVVKYGSDVKGLEAANNASYKSLVWSQPIFFWALPLTLAIGVLSLLIYVDSFTESKWKPLLVFVLTCTSFLLHVAEAILFVAYLFVMALLFGKRRESAFGATAAGALLTILYLIPGIYSGNAPSSSKYLLVASVAALIVSELRDRLLSGLGRIIELLSRRRREISAFLLSILTTGLIIWLVHMDEVDVNSLYYLGQVPWFFYPMMLGVSAFLAVVQLRSRFRLEYAVFVLVSLLLGRLITYYKLMGFTLAYWEYRFPLYASLGIAVLAAPLIGNLRRRTGRKWIAALLLGLIFFSGYATTTASVQIWYNVNEYGEDLILPSDFKFAIRSRFFETHHMPALVLTSYSSAMIPLMNPPSTVKQMVPWLSSGPEIPLYLLNSVTSKEKVAALFTISDLGFLEKSNASFSYLRRFMGPLLSYPSLTPINLKPPVSPESNLAIILPADIYLRRRALVAYELIRGQLSPHTIYLSDDPAAPDGVFIGAKSDEVTIDEDLPADPFDLRWIYIWGNFSRGLKVSGKRNVAISSYQLENGTYEISACGIMTGYVGAIYSFRNFANYRILQIFLENGIAVERLVEGGEVKSGKPIPVPIRVSDNCLNLTLTSNGTISAIVNGKIIKLSGGELGVVGLETSDFSGIIHGHVRGVHRIQKMNASIVLDVVEGELAEWVDRALRNISKTRTEFDLKIHVPRGEIKRIKPVAASIDLEASGDVVITGRPVWKYTDGDKTYLNEGVVTLRASKISFKGGEGFYVDISIEGAESKWNDGGKALIRFRTPLEIRAQGNITLHRFHYIKGYVGKAATLNVSAANLTVIAADNSLVFSKVEIPEKNLVKRAMWRAFDETRYLGESLLAVIVLTSVFLYIDRRYRWEPPMARTPAKRRRKGKERKGKGKGGKS